MRVLEDDKVTPLIPAVTVHEIIDHYLKGRVDDFVKEESDAAKKDAAVNCSEYCRRNQALLLHHSRGLWPLSVFTLQFV